MVTEATAELLSRHIDGDLDASEEQQQLLLLAAQPELQDELASMRELRDAVRLLAEQEEPPEQLSSLLEPLRRSQPPRVSVRPAYRWLAAAAMVVLAVTIGIEVMHHRPGPTFTLPTAQAPVQQEPFQLKPLPTPREEEELVGAVDRLLASPPPQEQLDDPPALDVVGPVDAPPGREALPAGEPAPSGVDREALDRPPSPADNNGQEVAPLVAEPAAERQAFAPSPEGMPAAGKSAEQGTRRGQPERSTAATPEKRAQRSLALAEAADGAVTDTGCSLVVAVGGQRLVVPCRADEELPAGRFRVTVRVADGVLVGLELDRSGTGLRQATVQLAALADACQRFVGTELPGTADGSYTSTVVVR